MIPTYDLGCDFLRNPRVLRQRPFLRQHHQMLMTIQFPNPLMISAALKIEERNPPEPDGFGCNTVLIIESPVDLRSGTDRLVEDRKLVAEGRLRQVVKYDGV